MTPEAEMVEIVGALWSAGRTRTALVLSDVEMPARRSVGTLLGVPTSDGQMFYPLFQFETYGDQVRVRPALAQFFKLLRDEDSWAVAMMTVTPTGIDELNGLSPVGWARADGDVDVLLDFAQVLRSEWSSLEVR